MLQSLGLGAKPRINIELSRPQRTYSTLDKISGKVVITATHNTRFDKLEIQFLGSTKTFIEKLQTTPGMSSSQSAFHNFLKLTQPIYESAYPQPRVLEAGRVYEFPFIFVVPQQLLPRICRHDVEHESVRDLHMQVPPSLGGLGDAEGLEGRLDDFAPEMININYHIVARLQEEGQHTISLETRSLDILPSFDEQPPVNVDGADNDYLMRKEKNIKKGLFKGRLGRLVVEADQPKSLRLPCDYAVSHGVVSTAATIRLRFDPADGNASPPKLSNLSTKLKVNNWYSDAAQPIVPNKKSITYDYRQGLHSELITLSSRSMENVEWKFHNNDMSLPTLNRRDSAISGSSSSEKAIPSASEKYQGAGFYTADILVPVTLPNKKHFVPTFHTCLVSRTYTLYLNLHTQGGTVTSPNVELKVPVQISAKSRVDPEIARASLIADETVEERTSADEFFVPRTISPMEQGLVWNSNLPSVPSALPPQYEVFAQGGRGVAVVR